MSVKWLARVLLADSTVVQMLTKDVSESGLGLIGERAIPAHSTLRVALAVPDLDAPGRFSTVTGTFKTAHVTVSGLDLIYGGVWSSIDGSGRELISKWIRKSRR